MTPLNPHDFIITRKRKKYRFALFENSPLCFELDEWEKSAHVDCLEVGAGTALFSVTLAERYPTKQFLAVDVKADRLQKGARMAEPKQLRNIRFLRARADQLGEYLVPGALEKIWITFPDPFPRERSAKHRLTHPRFLAIYRQLLMVGGYMYFKTDAHSLFDWSLEQLVDQGWRLHELTYDLHNSNLAEEYKSRTTYEDRFIIDKLSINFVRASR